ncbi:hypothetical protein VB715_19595 [Crocosphaera sp. UHCC 0190]|uniref:hypothetical protein n=1 Tax=Crocosphaera sp. UHCC 0190 TaxID=3110246 RepID=UPI002B1FFA12|nr:hypothetical protein [Crocosphaera sp. UHCC 0190]MEA5511981.1 hypothetical protein [Crocosphaera sp. UHCC 0190]
MPRWTKSAKKCQSELIKQWKPWNHSTGPRTSEGKQISSQNARKYDKEIQALLNYAKQTKTTLKKLNEELMGKLHEYGQLTDDDDDWFFS